ncbi:hypothetical protein D3C87_1505920 [compost metagenome]
MAAGGAHAQVVPILDDADARRVLVHQPGADQRVFIAAARPDAEPAQAMAAGGVNFPPADAPARRGTPGDGRRQAATGRGAEVGFDAQGVDQRTVLDRIPGHLLAHRVGPALAVLQT